MDRACPPDADRRASNTLLQRCSEKVFVELPAEASAGKGKVGRLLRSMYGCRDAGVKWECAFCEVMIAIGFV